MLPLGGGMTVRGKVARPAILICCFAPQSAHLSTEFAPHSVFVRSFVHKTGVSENARQHCLQNSNATQLQRCTVANDRKITVALCAQQRFVMLCVCTKGSSCQTLLAAAPADQANYHCTKHVPRPECYNPFSTISWRSFGFI